MFRVVASWMRMCDRYRQQLSAALDPEQDFGYILGIVGGSLMLILLGYPLRKRLKPRSTMVGSVRFWFQLHMFLGLVGPTAILFHARFSSNSFNGTVAMVAMIVVASSGLIGRFLYSRVHRGYSDRKLELRSLKLEMQGLLEELDAGGVVQGAVRQELEQFEAAAITAGGAFWSGAGAVLGLGVRSRLVERRLGRKLRAAGRGCTAQLERTLADFFISLRRAAEFAFFDRLLRLWHLQNLYGNLGHTEAKAIAHYNRGLTHEKLGDLQRAYEDFREALRLKPDFTMAASQLERFTVVPAGD